MRILRCTTLLATAASASSWATETALLEQVYAGETELLLANCSALLPGGRLRISLGGEGEEEAGAARIRCPSPGEVHLQATPRTAAPLAPCDMAPLGWDSPDGRDGAHAGASAQPQADPTAHPHRGQWARARNAPPAGARSRDAALARAAAVGTVP